MDKKAVVVSYNWDTQKILFTPFEGDMAGVKASDWASETIDAGGIWKDFPCAEGWVHFHTCTPEAAKEKGEVLTQRMGFARPEGPGA